MADTIDALVILGILLFLTWLGFLFMAVGWIIQHAAEVFAAVVILFAAAVAVHDYRRHRH